ncbi:hypothetical protein U1Q18_008330 [Sarracenia purpurea var. burkii]
MEKAVHRRTVVRRAAMDLVRESTQRLRNQRSDDESATVLQHRRSQATTDKGLERKQSDDDCRRGETPCEMGFVV